MRFLAFLFTFISSLSFASDFLPGQVSQMGINGPVKAIEVTREHHCEDCEKPDIFAMRSHVNQSGHLYKFENYRNGELSQRVVSEVNADQDKIKRLIYDGSGELQFEGIYKPTIAREWAISVRDAEGKVSSYQTDQYDALGRHTLSTTIYYQDREMFAESKTEYAYSAESLLATSFSSSFYYRGQLDSEGTQYFQYLEPDEHGNWTLQKVFNDAQMTDLDTTLKRKLSYW